MKKIKPYLILAASVLGILIVYKLVIQPQVASNATLSKYLPNV